MLLAKTANSTRKCGALPPRFVGNCLVRCAVEGDLEASRPGARPRSSPLSVVEANLLACLYDSESYKVARAVLVGLQGSVFGTQE
jgi:hypothetical protein